MGKLIHRKGDLFNALDMPKPVLVHAVSTMCVWGAGIALEFQRRWPQAFEAYRRECETHPFHNLIGSYGSWSGGLGPNAPVIAWVYTTSSVGKQQSPDVVVCDTESAVAKMIRDASQFASLSDTKHTFHSPRINSGLFGVPWEKTEAAIQRAIFNGPFDWTVWTL